jgi:multiple sugar transport system permease protein
MSTEAPRGQARVGKVKRGASRTARSVISPRANRDAGSAWLFASPALLLFTTFVVIPMVAVLALSFVSWQFLDTPKFVGFANYERLFSDSYAWQALGVTFEFLLFGVAPTVVLGFLVAVLLNNDLRYIGTLRVLYFIPVVLSVAVSAVVWGYLYDPRFGPIGALFRAFGGAMPDLLASPQLATPALTVIMVWGALPIVILLYLAALQRVPPDIYDAAALDGAGRWRTVWSITWPNVLPTTVIVAVLQVVGFSAGALDLALIMTGGGPLGSTRALGLYIYEQAFQRQDAGYAATLSLLQLTVIAAIVALGTIISRRRSG